MIRSTFIERPIPCCRGVTFMEMLAMEMKGQGLYLSRGLSFRCRPG